MKPSKGDIFLIGSIILCSFFAYVLMGISAGNKNGSVAEISVDGKIYKCVSLSENCELEIKTQKGISKIKVENNSIQMVYGDCPDRICEKQGAVSKTGESIVCLPNRIIITVKNGDKAEFDAIAG